MDINNISSLPINRDQDGRRKGTYSKTQNNMSASFHNKTRDTQGLQTWLENIQNIMVQIFTLYRYSVPP